MPYSKTIFNSVNNDIHTELHTFTSYCSDSDFFYYAFIDHPLFIIIYHILNTNTIYSYIMFHKGNANNNQYDNSVWKWHGTTYKYTGNMYKYTNNGRIYTLFITIHWIYSWLYLFSVIYIYQLFCLIYLLF